MCLLFAGHVWRLQFHFTFNGITSFPMPTRDQNWAIGLIAPSYFSYLWINHKLQVRICLHVIEVIYRQDQNHIVRGEMYVIDSKMGISFTFRCEKSKKWIKKENWNCYRLIRLDTGYSYTSQMTMCHIIHANSLVIFNGDVLCSDADDDGQTFFLYFLFSFCSFVCVRFLSLALLSDKTEKITE